MEKRSFGSLLNLAVLGSDGVEKIDSDKRPRQDSVSDEQLVHLPPTPKEGHQILLVRGFLSYLFDVKAFTFTRCADTIRDRSYFELQEAKGIVHAISTYSLVAVGTTESYDRCKDKWINTAQLPRKLRSVGSVSLNGSVYVVGGVDLDTMSAVDDVYQFFGNDSHPGYWVLLQDRLQLPRFRHAAAADTNGRMWIAGGIIKTNDEDNFTRSTEYWEDGSGWKKGPPMQKQRAIDVTLLNVGDNLYVVGGDVIMPSIECHGSVPVGSIEKFDRQKNEWVMVTKFPCERRGMCATAVDTRIFIFGGKCKDEDLLNFDVYNTKDNTWLSVKSPSTDRGMPEDCLYGQSISLPAVPADKL